MPYIYTSPSLLVTDGRVSLQWARNGTAPSAFGMRSLASDINCLVGYRLRALAAQSFTNVDTPDFGQAGNDTTIRVRSCVSPNATSVRVRMVVMPTDSVTYATPRGYWVITNKDTATVLYDDGTSGTDRSFVWDERVTTPDTVVPNDYRDISLTFTGLTGGGDYTFELHQCDGLRVISYTIYEIIRSTLDTSLDTVVDAPKFAEGAPIYNRDVLDVLGALDTAWKQLGTNHFTFSINNTTPKTMTGTTETNLLDGTTTTNGWTTTSRGFYSQAQYHDAEDTRVALTYQVPVVCYAYVSATVAGTGTLTWRTGTGANDYVAKITGITTAGWYTTAANLNGNNSSDKIDVTGTGSAAGTQINLYAAGAYERSS